MNSELYFNGLPTGPDVRKLESKFDDMDALKGSTIQHEEIEAVLGIDRSQARYKTVVNVWRKKIARDSGIEIRGDLKEVVGIGYRVLSDSEQLQFGGELRMRAGRKIRRSHVAIANTNNDNLTPEERRIKEHGILAGRHIHAAIMESRKLMIEATAPQETTKRVIPEKAKP